MLCWTVHMSGGPEQCGHAAVAVGHNVYVFGGSRNDDLLNVHVFNTVSLRWMMLPPTGDVPSRRLQHTAVLIEDIVYIWGGKPLDNWDPLHPKMSHGMMSGRYLHLVAMETFYGFNVDAHRWLKPDVSGTVPEARYGHSACVLGKLMYIHGGRHTSHKYDLLKERYIYKLDTSTMVWSLIKTRGIWVSAEACHSHTIIGTKMFAIRNDNWNNDHNEIVEFDTETECWLSTHDAEGLRSRSAFAYNGELCRLNSTLSPLRHPSGHLWKFNPQTFSWKKVVPLGRCPKNVDWMRCCCTVGDYVVLFGGYNAPNDLWILDLNPSLKTLCKLAVVQYDLEQSGLTHNIRWELAAMTTNSNRNCDAVTY